MSFKILEQEWYNRLKQSGFIDHESVINGKRVLTQNSPNAYRQADALTRECKPDYYSLLGYYVENNEFKSEIDRIIMQRYASGHRIQDISRKLQEHGCSRHRQTIRFVIRYYEHKWGIKNWTTEKLHPVWRTGKKVPIK